MSLHEITLPETEPETEWVLGQPIQKVSPTYWHASLQALIVGTLKNWSDANAYLSYATLPRDASPSAFQTPLGAPTVAVEILSPDDRPDIVTHKITTYLRGGSALVAIVDPDAETIALHDGGPPRFLRAGDQWTHAALPDFALDVADLFERAKRR